MEVHGFDIQKWGNWSILWVDSAKIDACLQHWRDARIDGLGIARSRRFTSRSFSFLRGLNDLRVLVLPEAADLDLRPVEGLGSLRVLSIGQSTTALRLSGLESLEELGVGWQPRLEIGPLPNLRVLHLGKYAPRTKDLTTLAFQPALERLALVTGNLTSLAGLEAFASVSTVELTYLRGLRDLGAIPKLRRLTELYIEKCPRISGYEEWVPLLSNLKALRLLDCQDLPSLSFIARIPSLRELRLGRTMVLDGDMSVCAGLDVVTFSPRKHYSHSQEQIAEMIFRRRRLG